MAKRENKIQRTNWNQVVKNINNLNNRVVNQRINMGGYSQYGGFNQEFLSQEYSKFFKREEIVKNKKVYGYNVAIDYEKAKEMYDKEELKEYMKERKQFLSYITEGKKKSYLSGTKREIEELSKKIVRLREKDVGDEWETNVHLKNVDYKETREWNSQEWKMVDEFKKHMNSDEAVELAFALLNNKEDIIKIYEEKGDKETRRLIDEYSEIYGEFDIEKFLGYEL